MSKPNEDKYLDFSADAKHEYDPNSIAGQRVQYARDLAAGLTLSLYGFKAFGFVTSADRAIALGRKALRSGWSADRVAAGLAEFVQAQEARERMA